MSEWISLFGCAVTGGLSLVGVIYASNKSAEKMDAKLDKQQAVTETKLDELTREVREHNNFAKRVPVLENDVQHIKQEISELKERGA